VCILGILSLTYAFLLMAQIEIDVPHLLPKATYKFQVSSFNMLGNSSLSSISASVMMNAPDGGSALRPEIFGGFHEVYCIITNPYWPLGADFVFDILIVLSSAASVVWRHLSLSIQWYDTG
jgi:hypothetical protein